MRASPSRTPNASANCSKASSNAAGSRDLTRSWCAPSSRHSWRRPGSFSRPTSSAWEANEQEPFADPTSLAVLRQRIDGLNSELIDALAEVRPWLSGLTVQQALPHRAEEILTGNGPAGVRETAIAPLRR